MKPDIFKFLEDIRLSINILEEHINTVESLDAYSKDLKSIDAVERRLAIIGEGLF
jgi:uncharacterized protein with HEPN domain